MNMWMIGVEVVMNQTKYNIFAIYHSPNSSDRNFLNKFEDCMAEWTMHRNNLVILGDFNIDLDKQTFYAKELEKTINNIGLKQLMNQPTRIYDKYKSRIDLLISNNSELSFEVHHTPKITDHSMIYVTLNDAVKTIPFYKETRDMKHFQQIQYQLDLMDKEWNSTSTNTHELAEKLTNILQNTLNKHAPIRNVLINTNYGHKKWWNQDIQSEIQLRDQMYKRAVMSSEGTHWTEFKQQRNRVVSIIREQKKSYYENKIDNVKNDPTEMWKTIKHLVNSKNAHIKQSITFPSGIYTKSKEISEMFNEYFLNSLHKINVSINKILNREEIIANINKPQCVFHEFSQINFHQLKKLTNNMKNKQSSVDGINTKILKFSFEAIGQHFLHLINNSLDKGEFPNSWKSSLVIPIEKKTGTTVCEEFRPVNMAPTYEKQLELVVNNQVVKYIESNNLLTSLQSGFRKNNSCESALQSVIVNWKNALCEKKMIGVVFLDFTRAFETIDRQLLLEKMSRYGFCGNVLKWFKEYLTDRTQKTKFNNATSSSKATVFGVPQGTVLGPTLFIMYINDIVKYVKNCQIQLFADDTILYFVGDNADQIIDVINEDLNLLYQWLNGNNLKVNISKTKFMIIKNKYGNQVTSTRNKIHIENQEISIVKEIKYLGIIVDEHLTFANHASYITKKVAKKVNLLGRIGQNLSSWTRKTIYQSIIKPHFSYCSSILFLCSNKEINDLQKKQNQAMRIILRCNKYSRIQWMLNCLEMLSVRQMIYLNTMLFIFKLLHGLMPTHLLNMCKFASDVHDYNTRYRNNFYVRTVRTNFAQNNLFAKGLLAYNNLPANIKNTTNVKTFKIECTKYLRNYINI